METENTSNERPALGPLSLLAIAVVLVVDIALPSISRSSMRESLVIGLSFGHVGAIIVWAFAAATLTWHRVAACYLAAVAMSLYFMFWQSASSPNFAIAAMLVTIWCTYATVALVAILASRWLPHRRRRSTLDDEQPPRFGVRHLLAATTLLAVASLIVRYALPELRSINHATIVVWILQSAMLTVVAVELLRQRLSILVQLGGLAAAGIAGTACLLATVDWDDAIYANAAQLAILSLAMVVPQLDRYQVQVGFEPRIADEPSDDLPQ